MILLITGIIVLVIGLFTCGLSIDYKLGAGIMFLGGILCIIVLAKPEWFEDYHEKI
jgi:hypothetical protein